MWFVVASALLVLVYVVLKPLGDGLTDTSAWAAKVMAPPGSGDNDSTKQYLRFAQAALMAGWLSNVPFFNTIAMVAALVFAALFHWWAALIVFAVAVFIGTLTKIIWGRSVSHYLMFMHARLLDRAATYRQKSDNERAEAGESMASELQQIIAVYMNVSLRPPTARQLQAMPYGDVSFYLNAEAHRAFMAKAPAAASTEGQKIIDQGQAGDEVRFTREQLDTMQGLVNEKIQTIEASKQAVIDQGAHEGKTIRTEAVLLRLEAAKAAHQGADREAYTVAADKLAREFREKYPDTIPVDEAYRLMKEWE